MMRFVPILAAFAALALTAALPAAAVDFTDRSPTSRDIRDALAGEGDGARTRGLDRSAGERRASLAIPFALNSAALMPAAYPLVDMLAVAILDPALSSVRIQIEGHTDASGSPERNLVLSAQRAATVIDALVQRGVPPWRLSGVGRGPSRPLPNLSPYDPRNRRVDATVSLQ